MFSIPTNVAMARPNPIRTAVRTPYFTSRSTAQIDWNRLTPWETIVWRISRSMVLMAAMVRSVMRGMIRVVWATIMPPGVKRNPRNPNGPFLERRRKATSPMITVGIA